MTLSRLFDLGHTHPYLTLVLTLLAALLVGSINILWSVLRHKFTPPISEEEEYQKRIEEVFEKAFKTHRELAVRARKYNRLNFRFTLIEIIGGAYFGIAASMATAMGWQQSKGQAVVNIVIGFVIAIVSGCQHAFHPFTKGKLWEKRAWILEHELNTLRDDFTQWLEDHKRKPTLPKLRVERAVFAVVKKAEEPFNVDQEVTVDAHIARAAAEQARSAAAPESPDTPEATHASQSAASVSPA
jgi:hypothetical protein